MSIESRTIEKVGKCGEALVAYFLLVFRIYQSQRFYGECPRYAEGDLQIQHLYELLMA